MAEGVYSTGASSPPIEDDSIVTNRLGLGLLHPKPRDLLLELEQPLLVLLTGLALGALAATSNSKVTDCEGRAVGESEYAVLIAAFEVGQRLASPHENGLCLGWF